MTALMTITLFGVGALSFMMIMYALERRHRLFIAGLAPGCLLSSAYAFPSGAWPFGVVEAIWAAIAWRRYREPARGSRPFVSRRQD
jgi:hypothetical protein